jgi:GT2 family glycosyltransferase
MAVTLPGRPTAPAAGLPGWGTLCPAPVAARVTLSVIVPTRNRPDLLAVQLGALATQEWDGDWEVIVADNAASAETVVVAERFTERLPSLRVVDASGRRGAAHARNVGAAVARGFSLVFVDDDDVVQPGWLAAMAAALEEHQFVASATDYELLSESAVQRARGNPQRHVLLRAWYPPHLPFAGGCGLGIRRELHERVRGFDEKMLAAQDNDYCFKVQLTAGVELRFVPDALIAVRSRSDRSGMLGQALRWSRQHVLLYKRYRPPGARIPHAWRLYFYFWKEWGKALLRARTEDQRMQLLWDFGWLLGQLVGAVMFFTTPVPFE